MREKTFTLDPGNLSQADINKIIVEKSMLILSPATKKIIQRSRDIVEAIVKKNNDAVYGINTGFGLLAQKRINANDLAQLQKNIILSHAAGTGDPLPDAVVRLILLLKINALAQGYSGVRLMLIEYLIAFLNHEIYPIIPAKGSVGASGDLAPLAHMSLPLLGVGSMRYKGKIISAKKALVIAGLEPMTLAPKEGLALVNGTQASTAIALYAAMRMQTVFNAAVIAGSLSVDAARGSDKPFSEILQRVRQQPGQILLAKKYRELLSNSNIRRSHQGCSHVQDPYSLRCQPQVMGTCFDHLSYANQTFLREANAVTDNPIIDVTTGNIISGGNFHAEPVAISADVFAIGIAEVGSISERRIALLCDPNFSQLPAFLVNNNGLHSGFMSAQYTSVSLASENKSLAHPASVDNLPTCANQEDHVSMATFAARRLLNLIDNTATIIAIELLAAAQGIDLLAPLKTSLPLERHHKKIREKVRFYDADRFFAPDIEAIKQMVINGEFDAGIVF